MTLSPTHCTHNPPYLQTPWMKPHRPGPGTGAYQALLLLGVREPGPAAFHDAVALGTILSSTDSVATLQVLKAVREPEIIP